MERGRSQIYDPGTAAMRIAPLFMHVHFSDAHAHFAGLLLPAVPGGGGRFLVGRTSNRCVASSSCPAAHSCWCLRSAGACDAATRAHACGVGLLLCSMCGAGGASDVAEGQINSRAGPGGAITAALAGGNRPSTSDDALPAWTGPAAGAGGRPHSYAPEVSATVRPPVAGENAVRNASAVTGAACATARAAAGRARIPFQWADGNHAFNNDF
jgi:hypothetical protein